MKKLSLFLLVVFIFFVVSCDDNKVDYNPNNSVSDSTFDSNQVIDGVRVTEEQWKKAFGENIVTPKGETETLEKYGFNSVTVTLESSEQLSYRNSNINMGKAVTMLVGDGWVCSPNIFYELYSGSDEIWFVEADFDNSGDFSTRRYFRGGSTAALEYVFEQRYNAGTTYIDSRAVGIDLKDSYDEQAFIEKDGVYQFIYKYSTDSIIQNSSLESLENDFYIVYKVKFNSNGFLTQISKNYFEIYDGRVSDRFYWSCTFSDYNNTQKPENFPLS